jgi:hypothetical protein
MNHSLRKMVMTFVVAGVVLLLALLVGAVFEDDEPNEDDPAIYASSSSSALASWRSSVSNPLQTTGRSHPAEHGLRSVE